MKFVLAAHGTRGDIEPCAAVGVELMRRGHEVRMAAPPNLLGFVDSVGLAPVAYGPDSAEQLGEDFFRKFWRIQNPISLIRAGQEYITRGWAEMSACLALLAEGADLVLTGMLYQEVAANVAEHHGVPLASLHYFPIRPNGHLLPVLPSPLTRSAISAIWWLQWRMTKEAEDAQRQELGLPKATGPSPQRFTERGALEIQAYEAFCFPGLAAEWGGRRPFVGSLTMELSTDADDEVASWIAAGTPPIYFGFGSMPVESPREKVAMISAACAELGERALICWDAADFDHVPQTAEVKIMGAVCHAAIFPACRAVVHHGGAGTTAAGMRAGVPALILWIGAEQPVWATAVRRLKVGRARRFSAMTEKSLVAELRRILKPQYATRACELAPRMTRPADAVDAAADMLEDAARLGIAGDRTRSAR
ncbi:glycosyltransferase [Candidatus Mycobacterium methanotrophicum]